MATTRAVSSRPSHLFDGPARTLARRPHSAFGNGEPCERSFDRQTRVEHEHGAEASGTVSNPRGPAHPTTAKRNRCVTARQTAAPALEFTYRHVRRFAPRRDPSSMDGRLSRQTSLAAPVFRAARSRHRSTPETASVWQSKGARRSACIASRTARRADPACRQSRAPQ